MNTDKEFVPYQPSLDMKEIGFDEPCFGRYNPDNDLIVSHTETYNTDFRKTLFTQAPTFSQAFRWFRDKRGLVSWISFRIDLKKKYLWYITDVKDIAIRGGDYVFDILIESYEESELACLKKLIGISKNK